MREEKLNEIKNQQYTSVNMLEKILGHLENNDLSREELNKLITQFNSYEGIVVDDHTLIQQLQGLFKRVIK